jgi:1L-myo-inositol 1-phosphate cytidylyltransferase
MPISSVSEAVILAAGNGVRLSAASDLPKPLLPVLDRTLLDYIIAALRGAAVRRLHIVTGHRGADIRRHVDAESRGVEVNWIDNPQYLRPNGLSLLAAGGHVRAPFVLLMADHLFEPLTLVRFLEQPVSLDGGLLAVDTKLDKIFDLDDATKVATRRGFVDRLGKDLTEFDAVDTGMFQFGPAVFDAMRTSAEAGDESLTGGVKVLAHGGGVQVCDIGAGQWVDVDTPEAWAHARRLAADRVFG